MSNDTMSNDTIGRPMEILLVEDNLVNARLTMGSIANGQVKHRLTLTRDGREALDFLFRLGRFARAPRPDLILLDLRLPEVDGLEVLGKIKSHQELRTIPVVVMTASDDEQDKLKCEQLNIDGYLTKPVDVRQFLDLIRQLRRLLRDDIVLPKDEDSPQ